MHQDWRGACLYIGVQASHPLGLVSRRGVSREIRGGRQACRAVGAERAACTSRRRPKARKLDADANLRCVVTELLKKGWSPRQVAGRLPIDHPADEAVRVSHEAIYGWIYALRKGELARQGLALRSGRTRRKPAHGRAPRIRGMRWIEERPAEATDRQVPGHWEGDLLVGKNGRSAVGTLVERVSRFVVLVPPAGRDAATVSDAVIDQVSGLPEVVRRSLTWDCGAEMAEHVAITLKADLPVYFAHPHSPWERGTNENTNRWLREYSPKAPRSQATRTTCKPSPTNSTTGPGPSLGSRSPKKCSPSY